MIVQNIGACAGMPSRSTRLRAVAWAQGFVLPSPSSPRARRDDRLLPVSSTARATSGWSAVMGFCQLALLCRLSRFICPELFPDPPAQHGRGVSAYNVGRFVAAQRTVSRFGFSAKRNISDNRHHRALGAGATDVAKAAAKMTGPFRSACSWMSLILPRRPRRAGLSCPRQRGRPMPED